MLVFFTQVSSALSEKDMLKSDLAVAKQTSRESMESKDAGNTEEISELQAKIGQLQAQLSEVGHFILTFFCGVAYNYTFPYVVGTL